VKTISDYTLNRYDLSCFLNWEVDVLLSSVTGIEFQSLGAMYEKDLSPAFLLVLGMLNEIRLDERRL